MGAVGYDLHSVEDCIIQPGERRCVGTGLAMCFPPETYGRIAPRSGLAVVWGIQTGAGIIDRQVFFNATKKTKPVNAINEIARFKESVTSQPTNRPDHLPKELLLQSHVRNCTTFYILTH